MQLNVVRHAFRFSLCLTIPSSIHALLPLLFAPCIHLLFDVGNEIEVSAASEDAAPQHKFSCIDYHS